MSNNATLSIRSLMSKLATVQTSLAGRSALSTTDIDLPVITVWSLRDAIATDQVYDDRAYTRSITIEMKIDASESDYHESLDDGLESIRAVLVPESTGLWLGGYALDLRQSGAQFLHPAPGGQTAAVQIPIEIDYYEG